MSSNGPHSFRLGRWLIEPDLNRLSRDSQIVTIESKTMAILTLLASRPGEVLSNDLLTREVWDDRPMGDNPVYKRIANLRKALGDDSKSPLYIETIARKGYRLVAKVTPVSKSTTDHSQRFSPKRAPLIFGVAVLVAVVIGTIWPRSTTIRPADEIHLTASKSIAVIPFENKSSDPDNDFFCHGIADELLNRLAQLPELRVVARTSSFSLGNNIQDLPKFATRLGVRYVLTGSVRQHEDMVRVTAKLLEGDGTLVWTDSYNRSLDSIYSVQNDIARAVMKGLSLNAGSSFWAVKKPTADFAAYAANMLGNEMLARRVGNWVDDSEDAFRKAINLDPGYAEPHAGLAITYLLGSRGNKSRIRDAEFALETALRLNPELGQAHAAAGLAAMKRGKESDYQSAVKSLRHALTLNPTLMLARNWLQISLGVLGKRNEALRILEEAIAIDPLNPILNMNLGRNYHGDGRLDEARAQMIRALTYPDTPGYVVTWLAQIDEDDGKLDVALGRLKEGVANGAFDADSNLWYARPIALYYLKLGLFDAANRWLAADAQSDDSRFRLGGHYAVLAPQQRYDQLAEHFQLYEATLSEEQRKTLLTRSLTGTFAVLRGEYELAIEILEPLFEEGWVLHNAPGGSYELFVTLHHLAVAYQRTGEEEKARALLNNAEEKLVAGRQERTHLIGNLLVKEAVTYRLLGQNELAIVRLREAVDAGWRQYYAVLGNPCWDGFRDDPEFERLMADVKRDVDLQRERVVAAERLHPFEPPSNTSPRL